MALAHPNIEPSARETIATDYFVDALDDPDFSLKVRERMPKTLDDALRAALQLEAWTKDAHRVRRGNTSTPKVRSTDADQQRLEQRLNRLEGNLDKLVSTMMRSQNTVSSNHECIINGSVDTMRYRSDENRDATLETHPTYDANVISNQVDSQATGRGKRGPHPSQASESAGVQNKIG